MQPGHPYATKALDELRSQQRRMLRSIPAWLIERHGAREYDYAELGSDRAMVEWLVRKRVDELWAEAAAVLEQCEADIGRWRLHEFLWHQADSHIGARETTAEGALEVEREIAKDRRGDYLKQLPDDLGSEIMRVVYLLTTADLLDEGGYRDPRCIAH